MNLTTTWLKSLPTVTFLNTSFDPPERFIEVHELAETARDRVLELQAMPHIADVLAVDACVTPSPYGFHA